MKRGNKVRYKKTLKFEIIEGTSNERIISYENEIGKVDYTETKVINFLLPHEITPMNWKHLKWALGRAKNKTNSNLPNSSWGIIQGINSDLGEIEL